MTNIGHNGGPALDLDLHLLTKAEAGNLSIEQARALVGSLWNWHQATENLQTAEGRQKLHRVWLQNKFSSEPAEIPTSVLISHMIGRPSYMARCWFARQVASRSEELAIAA